MVMLVALRSFDLAMRSFGVTGFQQGLLAILVNGSLLQDIFSVHLDHQKGWFERQLGRSSEKLEVEAHLGV
jgi:hypothetical protein